MIVQCEACQTRFRLADDKVKPGGTKVRCSKCKEVFTVHPPEPEPADETVEFGAFNMERLADEPPVGDESPGEDRAADRFDDGEQETEPGGEIDFSAFEQETAADRGGELADEFSFADTSQPAAEAGTGETTAGEFDFGAGQDDEPGEYDFGAGQESGPGEFDFGSDGEPEPAAVSTAADEFDSTDAFGGPADEFAFDGEETEKDEAPAGEFAFGEENATDAFSFDEEPAAPAAAPAGDEIGFGATDEFSFEDDAPFGEESTSDWEEQKGADGLSFDFDEPSFDSAEAPAAPKTSEEGDLKFGEIDFASESEEDGGTTFDADSDFSRATMERREESAPLAPSQPSAPPPVRERTEDEPPPPRPAKPKKSALSRILTLLVLLLLIVGGAAGYLFMQEGTLDLNTLTRYLPFLKEYIGETAPPSPGDRIGINISGSYYVNGKAGQMLVIQGEAINNHKRTRSAITVKGILLDAQGKKLLQQTVFCGNKLDDQKLQSMSFAEIEEAMNNQFGDSLSNMNVAAGTAIPFTIVFRNLPAGIANINIEVVDSKPGAG